MARHASGNRAALGGMMSVIGFFMLFMEGYLRIAGLLIMLFGLVSIFFAFVRPR
jgi:membrane-bound ClpP family serine protease